MGYIFSIFYVFFFLVLIIRRRIKFKYGQSSLQSMYDGYGTCEWYVAGMFVKGCGGECLEGLRGKHCMLGWVGTLMDGVFGLCIYKKLLVDAAGSQLLFRGGVMMSPETDVDNGCKV